MRRCDVCGEMCAWPAGLDCLRRQLAAANERADRAEAFLEEIEGAFASVAMDDECRACDGLNDVYQEIRVRVVNTARANEED